MPEATVNGVRIWYQETCEGDPVVQIHGAGFGHFNVATATPILSKCFRCIDFDMRGYGLSNMGKSSLPTTSVSLCRCNQLLKRSNRPTWGRASGPSWCSRDGIQPARVVSCVASGGP
jgi:pimeloyl-ACP methyl ester carboxylesterase